MKYIKEYKNFILIMFSFSFYKTAFSLKLSSSNLNTVFRPLSLQEIRENSLLSSIYDETSVRDFTRFWNALSLA